MKKLISLFCLFMLFLTAKAGVPTDDYMHATQLQYDTEYELYYFDVELVGEHKYVSYGLDIQLPAGMEVVKDEYGIFVERIDGIYPTSGRNKVITHEVSPNFPYEDDHSHLRVGCMSNPTLELVATEGSLFRVYVTIDDAAVTWPIGAIKLYKMELGAMDETPYNPADQETIVPVHTGETSLPLTVSSANHWSTCILPFATEIPTGVKAYTSSTSDADNIFLTEANSIEAYTPYILYSENGFSGTVSGTVAASGCPESGIVTVGNLTGAVVSQTVKNGYILQKHDDVVQFYAIGAGDSFLVPAGKCWMNIAASDAKALNFVIEGNETAILNIKSTSVQNGVYDLTGRRVSTLKQGRLYIKNGEKLIGK